LSILRHDVRAIFTAAARAQAAADWIHAAASAGRVAGDVHLRIAA
jgi:antirestriction protein ArdC